jgi:hypothetical protein
MKPNALFTLIAQLIELALQILRLLIPIDHANNRPAQTAHNLFCCTEALLAAQKHTQELISPTTPPPPPTNPA